MGIDAVIVDNVLAIRQGLTTSQEKGALEKAIEAVAENQEGRNGT